METNVCEKCQKGHCRRRTKIGVKRKNDKSKEWMTEINCGCPNLKRVHRGWEKKVDKRAGRADSGL
jgi:hypothetical protein